MMRGLCLILALLVPAAAIAHSFYPIECCHDQDCFPVKCEDIIDTPTGYKYDGVTFSKSMEKPSQDRHCHVCIGGKGETRFGICLFTMQGT